MNCNKKCHGCPFEYSDLSEQIQNYGCLPTPQEIINMRINYNKTWACHSEPEKACIGAIKELKEKKLPYKIIDKDLLTENSDWHLFLD